jgi:quinol-cytochrome oxidoreductase complex cytochrome b subunit
MFMFQTLKYVPGGEILGIENEAFAIMGFSLAGLLALLVPFLDRGAVRRGRSPLFSLAGFLALGFIVVMTAVGYHAWWPVWSAVAIALGPWALGRWLARRGEEAP